MNLRALLVKGFGAVASMAFMATLASAAPTSLGELSVTPKIVAPGTPTVVRATVLLDDATLIAQSFVLDKVDNAGKRIARLANFAEKSPGRWVAEFVANESKGGESILVASAAFKGTVLRVRSGFQLMIARNDADTSSAKAEVIGSELVFTNAEGESVRVINVESVRGTDAEGDPTETSNTVAVSENQTRAAVLSLTAPMATTGMEEEIPVTQSTISIYSAVRGQIGLVEAPELNTLFIPPAPERLLSFSGHRLAIGFQNNEDKTVQLAAYSENGTHLYLGTEVFADIMDLAISEDGEYLGALMVRERDRTRIPVFIVIAIEKGQLFEREFSFSAAFGLQRLASGFRLDFDSLPSISLP